MYINDFKIEDNMEDSTSFILEATNKKIEEIKNMISEDITTTMYNDIENWVHERFDNVRRRYFDEVKSFLLGESRNEELEKWLLGLGYDQQKFREKIYKENKEVINKAIAFDSVYEILENMFKSSYFKSWEFSDINKGYPQSEIVRGFLHMLIQRDGFNSELKNLLDKSIQNQMDELKALQSKVNSIRNELENI